MMQSENPDSLPSAEAAAPRSRFWFGAAFFMTASVATAGSLVLCSHATPFFAGLFFVPFAFGPLAVTLGLSVLLRSKPAQAVLTVSSVLYAVWFGYVYLQAFHLNSDPQSPIAFLFVGVYALPVLIGFWIAAGVTQWRTTTQPTELG